MVFPKSLAGGLNVESGIGQGFAVRSRPVWWPCGILKEDEDGTRKPWAPLVLLVVTVQEIDQNKSRDESSLLTFCPSLHTYS